MPPPPPPSKSRDPSGPSARIRSRTGSTRSTRGLQPTLAARRARWARRSVPLMRLGTWVGDRDRTDEAGRTTNMRALPVAGLVLASSVVWLLIGRHVAAPWIMVDELEYGELGRSFADGDHFLIRGDSAHGY